MGARRNQRVGGGQQRRHVADRTEQPHARFQPVLLHRRAKRRLGLAGSLARARRLTRHQQPRRPVDAAPRELGPRGRQDRRQPLQPFLRTRVGDGQQHEVPRADPLPLPQFGGGSLERRRAGQRAEVDPVPHGAGRDRQARFAQVGLDGLRAGDQQVRCAAAERRDPLGPPRPGVVDGQDDRDAGGGQVRDIRAAQQVPVHHVGGELPDGLYRGLHALFAARPGGGDVQRPGRRRKGRPRRPPQRDQQGLAARGRLHTMQIQDDPLRPAALQTGHELHHAQAGGEMNVQGRVADDAARRLGEFLAQGVRHAASRAMRPATAATAGASR